jgi:hypothetical protein
VATALRFGRFQRHLEDIYDITDAPPVDGFVTTDRRWALAVDDSPRPRDIPEKLLISESGDSLELSLYLDGDLIRFLAGCDPLEKLHGENVNQFWTVLEGISHFLYTVFNARHDRSITRFELELQAEVDKFIAAGFLRLHQQGHGQWSDLHRLLFARPRFDARLDHAEGVRYYQASHYAASYCGYLQRRYLHSRRYGSLTRELRRFYRLRHRAKLRHIELAA